MGAQKNGTINWKWFLLEIFIFRLFCSVWKATPCSLSCCSVFYVFIAIYFSFSVVFLCRSSTLEWSLLLFSTFFCCCFSLGNNGNLCFWRCCRFMLSKLYFFAYFGQTYWLFQILLINTSDKIDDWSFELTFFVKIFYV